MNACKKTDFLIIAFLLILAGAVRLSFAFSAPYAIDYDSSMVGTMAQNMIREGRFETFFYGESYSGTFEAFCTFLFFFIFGESKAVLFGTTAFLSLINLLLCFFLAKECFNKRTGIITLLLLIIPAWEALLYSYFPRVVYAVTPLFSTALLLVTVKLIKNPSSKFFVLMGLLLGIGWWNHALIIYAATTSFLMLLFFYPRVFIDKRSILIFVFMIIGSLPWWIFNFQSDFSSIKIMCNQPPTSLMTGIENIFLIQLPALFFTPWYIPQTAHEIFSNKYHKLLFIILSVLSLIPLIRIFIKKTTREEKLAAAVPLMLFCVCLVFLLYGFRRYTSPRFVLPFYYASIILMAFGFDYFLSKMKGLTFLALSCFILFKLDGYLLLHKNVIPHEEQRSENFKRDYIDPLLALNVPFGITSLWDKATQISFLTGQKIQIAAESEESDRMLELRTDAFESPFLLFSNKNDFSYEENLQSAFPADYKTAFKNENTVILSDLQIKPGKAYRAIPFTSLYTDHSEKKPFNFLFDRNPNTFYESQAETDGSFQMMIQMDKPQKVSRMMLISNASVFAQNPDSLLKIFTSKDGKTWDLKKIIKQPTPVYLSSHKITFHTNIPKYEYDIPSPDAISWIKLESNCSFYYSEAYLFEELQSPLTLNCEVSKLAEFINSSGFEKVFIERHKSAKLISSGRLTKAKVVNPKNLSLWVPLKTEGYFYPEKESSVVIVDPFLTPEIIAFFNTFDFKYTLSTIDGYDCFHGFSKGFKGLNYFWNETGFVLEDTKSNYIEQISVLLRGSNKEDREALLARIKLLSDISPFHLTLSHYTDIDSVSSPFLINRIRENQALLKNTLPEKDFIYFGSKIGLSGIEMTKVSQEGKWFYKITINAFAETKNEAPLYFFFHFKKRDQILFQDDFFKDVFDQTTEDWSPRDIHKIERMVPIPEGLDTEELSLSLGIWSPTTNKRRLKIIKSGPFPVNKDDTLDIRPILKNQR